MSTTTSPTTSGADTAAPPAEQGDPAASAAFASAASTGSGLHLSRSGDGWMSGETAVPLEADAYRQALESDAYRQLARCFPRWSTLTNWLHPRAWRALAANEPIDPSDPGIWRNADACAMAVLRRHRMAKVNVAKLSDRALTALVDGQREADRAAGIDWATVHVPASDLDGLLRAAHRTLPIDLGDPAMWALSDDQRRTLAARFGLDLTLADSLSRWAIANPDQFDAASLRSWRIGSPTWQKIAAQDLAGVDHVARPVGVFISPDIKHRGGWCLDPCLSLDMIRLISDVGGAVDRSLRSALIPGEAVEALLKRVNKNVLCAGSQDLLEFSTRLTEELSRQLGQSVAVSLTQDPRDRWGRIRVVRYAKMNDQATGDVHLEVMTTTVRGFPVKRLGAARVFPERSVSRSAPMELGEAVDAAVDRGVPLLLSSEAAGLLDGTVRVGRMRGRPGMLTITSSDGVEAHTARLVAEQAIHRLKALQGGDLNVILDAGARQLLKMTLARPLADDPVLVGRQKLFAAVMAVGSGLNASEVGTGKTVVTGRALYQMAVTTPGLRVIIAAEGRLIRQWLDELTEGAPARGLPPLLPNAEYLVVDERTPVASQIREFHRRCDDRAGVVLVPDGILDRYHGDLAVINWHMLVADEAARYANPLTEAHKALHALRMNAVANCWLLTATPRGKSSEALDILVGLAIGDETMISERLNTREGGNLLDEIAAHRVRANYGLHLVRMTSAEMGPWMPTVLPAQPVVVEADPALRALIDAIREGGQGAWREMLKALKYLKTLEKGTEIYKAALVEVSRAMGVVLGHVGVYVDASVDPETLIHSKATLAQALTENGLVEAAMRGGGDGQPTLRGITAQAIAEIARGDEQILVFADRLNCLRQLMGSLIDRHGIDARLASGGITDDDFHALKRQFAAGEFPVLCLSRIGEKGHNLQTASMIVHLDLPWLPGGIEQRVGRAKRPGSPREFVRTIIPYIKGAGMEHIVGIVSERGGEQHLLLDSYEGVAAADSTVASQLAAITAEVADSREEAGYDGDASRLRVAASVFGADL